MPLTRCPASSPVLGSFGPSMDLASELLHGGHRKPVLAYLDSCAKFWQPETIAAWKAEIEAGKLRSSTIRDSGRMRRLAPNCDSL